MRDWVGALLLGAITFALGCASGPPRPAPAPPLASAVAPCADPQPHPTVDDVCDGHATPEGLQCVLCDVPRGCLLVDAAVYCAPACVDPYCGDGPARRR
jgi:hypothetical protein